MKIKLNENFTHLSEKYLFSEISDRVERFKASGKGKSVISLGIGDVSLPISRIASLEMARVSLGLGFKSGFHGYADTLGDKDLRRAISSRYAGRKQVGSHTQSRSSYLSENKMRHFSPFCPYFSLFSPSVPTSMTALERQQTF